MSSDTADFVAAFASATIGGYCNVAASALIFYEYCVTLRQEVDMFWKGRISGSTVLFLFNRYFVLLFNCYALAASAVRTDVTCTRFQRGELALLVCQYFPWAVFSALRVFALGRNWFPAALVFVLSCVPIGINFSDYVFGLTGSIDVFAVCDGFINMPEDVSKKIAHKNALLSATRLNNWSFTDVFLRDGTIYFLILVFLNALHLALTLESFDNFTQNSSYVTVFTEPITAILVSRFLIHIQEANRKALALDTRDAECTVSHTGTLVFDRIIGSLAASIMTGEDVIDEDIEENSAAGNQKGADLAWSRSAGEIGEEILLVEVGKED